MEEARPDKSKKLKKAEGKESPQPAVVAANSALGKAQKERNNKAQNQVDVLGMLIFQLYGNLLTYEVCQPWEKIVKAQTNTIP